MLNTSTSKLSYTYKKASFIKRLAAFYLAFLLIVIFSYLVSYVASEIAIFGVELYSKSFWTLFLSLIVLGFITDGFFQCLLTFNIAKLILGLRVVDERQYAPISFIRSFFRTLFGFISFLIGGLGFISILFNREKLSMHDLLVHSSVIDLSKSIFTRVISAVTAFFIVIPGIIIHAAFIFVLVSSPLFIWSSVKDYQNQKSIEIAQWIKKPDIKYSINLENKEALNFVTFLITDTAQYREDFFLAPSEKQSTIDFHSINILSNLDKLKLDVEQFMETRNLFSSFYMKFSKIIFKTNSNYDLSIRNPKFYITYENKLANDLLSTFNYNVIEQKNTLEISLLSNLKNVLANKDASYRLKSNYIKAIYFIESKWYDFLLELPINERVELNAATKELANNIKVKIDSETGYIKQFDIIHPGKNTLFNRVTNRFLNDLQFKVVDLNDLDADDLKQLDLEFTLVYRELI